MKRIILTLALLAATYTLSFAQCDQKVIITSSKTEYLDASGTVQRTEEEKAVIEFSKTAILIRPDKENHEMTGTIQSDTCNWKIPFKEGKTILKAAITSQNGDTKNVTITIEGKDGKRTFLMEIEDMPEKKIRVTIDTFQEKK